MIVLRNTDKQLLSATDTTAVLRDLLRTEDAIDQDKEHYYVIHLDSRSKIKLVELVSLGTLNSAITHPRETFRRAVVEGACSIIIAHNHPSGDVTPSEEDIKVTKLMHEAGRVLGIDLVDHIIFSFNRFFSFRENATHEQ